MQDILEAGVRIIAQPPGKKLQNMMQLSGGEKALTAISLLFAIQNLKPSPFCLLDEIEAALDDSNVTRFAQYLHKLTKNTQFIVITHRRGTMNAADRLYGITMQEKGVSTLVSVDLLEGELEAQEECTKRRKVTENEEEELCQRIRDFFNAWSQGLPRPGIISYPEWTVFSVDFLRSTMIFMKSWKKH